MAWLPTTYTLQAQFLARNPTHLSGEGAILIFAIGLSGYLLFRSANNQKYRVRNSAGKCTVWGRPASFIEGQYKTADGAVRTSMLLTSGKSTKCKLMSFHRLMLTQDGGAKLATSTTSETSSFPTPCVRLAVPRIFCHGSTPSI